jgi:hypothetical protein
LILTIVGSFEIISSKYPKNKFNVSIIVFALFAPHQGVNSTTSRKTIEQD